MKIVANKVEVQENLNNGRYNFYVDEDNLIKFSDNIYTQIKNKSVTLSYGNTHINKITIEF